MTKLSPCIFLDRDGVINRERGEYTFRISDFEIIAGVSEALLQLKAAGYLLVLITNQAGIAKGLYTHADVKACHEYMQEQCQGAFDGIYYSPYHPVQTESLGRKPGRLLFEKAIARFGIDPSRSWMVGDKERDLLPARELGIRGILVGDLAQAERIALHQTHDLATATPLILQDL